LNFGGKGSALPHYLITFYLLVEELKQPKFNLLNFFFRFLETNYTEIKSKSQEVF